MPFNQEGPALELLHHRLVDIPLEFLEGPDAGALLHDTLRRLNLPLTGQQLSTWRQQAARENHALLPLFCWLLATPELAAGGLPFGKVWYLLTVTSPRLATLTKVKQVLNDTDRREELLRLMLADLDRRPAGETPAQAQDRLSSISSLERARILEAARAAEARAQEIREALRRKAAQEGADKWARE